MRYEPGKIEPKWQKRWLRERAYEPNLKRPKRPFYNLMMFPYPSAEGLHVGNMYAFVGSDIYGRAKRMQGYDVFEPIGLDGFGIHSENYALKIGQHPAKQARISEKNFYRQLALIGNGFSWAERLETYDPDYYRWTQWIFAEMFRQGLAYRKRGKVNWCPSCKTVLADEQVISGECERCETAVKKRELEQWFFRITNYAERLLQSLETIDWSERVKIAQRNWIGKSEGAEIEFPVQNAKFKIKVFTTRPDTLFGATYMVLAPEHGLVKKLESRIENLEEVQRYVAAAGNKSEMERTAEGKEKTGIALQGVQAINPANSEAIPVWISDYVLAGYGTGAIMAVPAHDERDFEFAKKFKLKIRCVIQPFAVVAWGSIKKGESKGLISFEDAAEEVRNNILSGRDWHDRPGTLVDSGDFSGHESEQAKWEITKFVSGTMKTQYRLRDWLISRQRYWGPPIPMIFCDACRNARRGERSDAPGWYAVATKDLPVKLPMAKEFRPTGTGQSPLASVKSFVDVKCPKCRARARRETDVSDTFLDSAWYFLRYPSIRSAGSGRAPWDAAITKQWLPVNRYIGGAEHSVLHLLYSRFLAMVFHDWGLVNFEEPFTTFRAHGLLIKDGAKMSKSKGNVVNPDEYIRAYGADALRMYLMFLGPFEQGGDFRDTGIRGITRFLERVWKLGDAAKFLAREDSVAERQLHQTIAKVAADIEGLRYNTAISALMVCLSAFENSGATRNEFAAFLQLLAPFAPHLTEELWGGLKQRGSIHRSRWPEADLGLIAGMRLTVVIQVNGKVRDRIEIEPGTTEDMVRKAALEREQIRRALGNREPKKAIYVPGRILNFVL